MLIPILLIITMLTAWTQLKKDFGIVKRLQEQSGFGWDSTTSKVTVPNDFWEKYLQVIPSCIFETFQLHSALQTHKKAKIWRTKAVPVYNDIHILVQGIITAGDKIFQAGTVAQCVS